MEPLLSHPDGFTLAQAGGRFDLHYRGHSMCGPFTLHWAYTGSHGQLLERSTTDLSLAAIERLPPLDPSGELAGLEVRLEYTPYGGARAAVRFRLHAHGLELSQSLTRDAPAGRKPLEVHSFRLSAQHLAGTFLDGLGEADGWRFFPTGYGSFSPSFVRDSRAVLPLPRVATAGTFAQYPDSIYWGRWSDLSTPWMATLHRAGVPDTLLAGFLEARTGVGEVALRRRSPTQLEVRLDLGGRQLRPDETLHGDALLLAFGPDGDALIRAWTLEAGQRMAARARIVEIPGGWCSQYYHTAVTQADVYRNLRQLDTQRDRLPVSYVRLDDGYQAHVGDWLTVNPKFPSGLESVARRIRTEGFLPGIWTAPFLVQRSSEVFRRHPDWLLRSRDGKLERYGYHPVWGVLDGQLYTLDPTHPEVLAHLTEVYTTLVRYGFESFKIDFLAAGLRPGRHHDPACSPVEAYRRGLEVIRAAVGERFLLGCGAPLMPSIGLVDAMRISPDVKEDWRDPPVALLANGVGHPSAELAILNSLTRAHFHGVWWLNDPDCLLAREKRSTLKIVEVQTLVSVLSLTGGPLFLGDDLEALEPARRRLVELALPAGGTPARTLRLAEEDRPQCFIRTRDLPDGGSEVLAALINWSDALQDRSIDPEALNLPTGAYHAFELWSESYRCLEPGQPFTTTLDPHETSLLLLRPVRPHPQLITATHHVGQTTVIVALERWDPDGTLTIGLRVGAPRDGQLWIAVPDGHRLTGLEAAGGARIDGQASIPGGVRLDVPVVDRGEVRLRFERLG